MGCILSPLRGWGIGHSISSLAPASETLRFDPLFLSTLRGIGAFWGRDKIFPALGNGAALRTPIGTEGVEAVHSGRPPCDISQKVFLLLKISLQTADRAVVLPDPEETIVRTGSDLRRQAHAPSEWTL